MMRLSKLIATIEGAALHGEDRAIRGLTEDSRKVEEGFLFVAVAGTKENGSRFIEDAVRRGAAGVLMEAPHTGITGETIVTVPNVRHALPLLAARFYPRQPESVAAITGTSGKTSTAQFLREMWSLNGHRAASLGTLGLITPTGAQYGTLTTPDPLSLHRMLDDAAAQKITHMAMEASSHGLDLHRMDGVKIKAAGFTNLSRDHLDYHATMDAYLAAKLRLFSEIMPEKSVAVVNADSAVCEKVEAVCTARGHRILTYGTKGDALKVRHYSPQAQGQRIGFDCLGKPCDILLPMIGAFQIWNSLCALGLALGCGEDETRTVAAMEQLSGVPGRLELAGTTDAGAAVFVDYAHKPDALENVLTALRPHAAAHGGKLYVVFGCGGERDKGKRPLMGAIAQRLADGVIVTDDNPRHDDPATIRREILTGCRDAHEIADRAEAIAAGIDQLRTGDVLVIAGKGHEKGQIVGDDVLPFDDRDVARDILGRTKT